MLTFVFTYSFEGIELLKIDESTLNDHKVKIKNKVFYLINLYNNISFICVEQLKF